MATNFRVEGLSDLDDALKQLPKAVARDVLVKVLTEQGKPIRDAGAALAPRRTGHLADSYTITTHLSGRQMALNVKESDVEVYIGPGPAAESVQTEFGNAHQAAEPHLRPAFDGNVGRVLDGIAKSLAVEIENAREKSAAKQAGLLRIIADGNGQGVNASIVNGKTDFT